MKIDGSKVRIALAAAIIGVLLGAYIGFAASPSTTFTISPGIYPGAPTYTVWREGSYYFAKNSNGEIEFSGTNASQIIQNCIDNMDAGGTLLLRQGTYDITHTIIATNSILLKGEIRWGTKLNGQNMVTCDPVLDLTQRPINLENLQIVGYHRLMVIGVYSTPHYIKNVYFAYGKGVVLNGTEYYSFQNCYFRKTYAGYAAVNLTNNGAGYLANYNFFRDCAFKENDGYSVYMNGAQGNIFDGCGFEGNNELPIYIKDGDFNTFRGSWIEGNTGTDTNVWIEKGTANKIAERTTFSGSQTYDIVIGNESNTVRYTEIDGCYFISNHVHINIGTNGLYTSIQRNRFRSSSPISDNGQGTYRMFNNGYTYGYTIVTGTQAGVSNGDWISYGVTFGQAPQVIIVTPRSSATVWVSDRNATHFQVGTSASSITIDWIAEYKP